MAAPSDQDIRKAIGFMKRLARLMQKEPPKDDRLTDYATMIIERGFAAVLDERTIRFIASRRSFFPDPREMMEDLADSLKSREHTTTTPRTPENIDWAKKVLTICVSVRAFDDPWPQTVSDEAVRVAKTILTPEEIEAIEAKATPQIPLTIDHVIDHVIRSVGPRSITRRRHQRGAAGAQDIIRTWVKKCGPGRVLEAAQAHARERPLRCIPWIEDRLYGPLSDPQPVQTLIDKIVAERKPTWPETQETKTEPPARANTSSPSPHSSPAKPTSSTPTATGLGSSSAKPSGPDTASTKHDRLKPSVLGGAAPQPDGTHGLRQAPEMVWSNPNAGPWTNPNK